MNRYSWMYFLLSDTAFWYMAFIWDENKTVNHVDIIILVGYLKTRGQYLTWKLFSFVNIWDTIIIFSEFDPDNKDKNAKLIVKNNVSFPAAALLFPVWLTNGMFIYILIAIITF